MGVPGLFFLEKYLFLLETVEALQLHCDFITLFRMGFVPSVTFTLTGIG